MKRGDLVGLALLLGAFVGARGLWLHETFGAQSLEALEFGQVARDLDAGLLASRQS